MRQFAKLKEVLERPETPAGQTFAFFIQFLILVSIVSFSLETLPNLSPAFASFLNILEVSITLIFTAEYLLRIYVADRKPRFVFSFFGLVDLVAILPFFLGQVIDLRSIRIIRMMRVFRILKVARYTRAIERLRRAIVEIKEELIVYLMVTTCLMYMASIGIYYFERDVQPEHFGSVFHAMWWSIVTLSTVGYGDAYPVTTGGRIFTGCILWLGVGVISVPSGLMASSLAKVDREAAAKKEPEE